MGDKNSIFPLAMREELVHNSVRLEEVDKKNTV